MSDSIRTRREPSAPDHSRWMAWDDNTYDGPGCPIGTGATEEEAIDDLREQLT